MEAKNWWKNFNKFTGQTAIKPISFITSAESKVELFWWIFVLAICSGLTIWTFSENVIKYRSGASVTRVSMQNQKFLNFDPPLLCVYSKDFRLKNRSVSNNNDSDDWRDNLNPIEVLKNYADSLRSNLNTNEDQLALAILTVAVETVLNVVAVENVDENNLHWDYETNLIKHQSLKSAKVSELIQLVGTILCLQMNLKIGIANQRNWRLSQFPMTSLCDRSRITWLGATPLFNSHNALLCLKLGPDEYFTYDYYNYRQTVITANIESYADDIYLFMQFSNSSTINQESTLLAFAFGSEYEVLLEQHQITNLPTSDCIQTHGYGDCVGYCISADMLVNCNCWPSSWIRLAPTNVPECQYTSNSTCLQQSYAAICVSECADKCDRQIAIPNEKIINDTNDQSVVITIKPASWLFSRYQEVLEVDSNRIISLLGGSLSLYVGASFMGLLHILVFLARHLATKLVSHRQIIRQISSFKKENECRIQITNR